MANYHKLVSKNLNTVTLLLTADFYLTSSSAGIAGINRNKTYDVVLELIDYVDTMNITHDFILNTI
jgi:hypothetical protein